VITATRESAKRVMKKQKVYAKSALIKKKIEKEDERLH